MLASYKRFQPLTNYWVGHYDLSKRHTRPREEYSAGCRDVAFMLILRNIMYANDDCIVEKMANRGRGGKGGDETKNGADAANR